MTDLKFFMGLLKLISSAEEELGLENLTQKDRQVLQVFWSHKDASGEIDMTYETFCQRQGHSKTSRAQYFKSIQKLVESEMIQRLGSARSHKFKFLA